MATPTTLYQYYTSKGLTLPSIGERSGLYEQYGLGSKTSYFGTAAQNTSLLTKLLAPPTATTTAQAGTAPAPTAPAEVQPYLDQVALSKMVEKEQPQVRSSAQIATDLKSEGLLPTTTRPEAPKMVDTFKQLRSEQGVTTLEQSLNDLKAAEEELAGRFEAQRFSERGKPVALNVIQGRVSEEEQQYRMDLEFVQRQKSRVTDQLNVAYNLINTIMGLTNTDYQNAAASYDASFNQNLKTIELVRGIQRDEKDDRQKAIDNARANAQLYVNLMKDGNLSYDQMSSDQRLQLGKLEVQSGLQVGFFSKIRKDPKADIIATNDLGNGQTQVLTRNQDGTISVQRYGSIIPKTYAPTDSQRNRADSKSLFINDSKSIKGYQSPKGWVGEFPQLVSRYADTLTLPQIYSAYRETDLYKKWGEPKEPASAIQDIYNSYK